MFSVRLHRFVSVVSHIQLLVSLIALVGLAGAVFGFAHPAHATPAPSAHTAIEQSNCWWYRSEIHLESDPVHLTCFHDTGYIETFVPSIKIIFSYNYSGYISTAQGHTYAFCDNNHTWLDGPQDVTEIFISPKKAAWCS